MTIDDIITDAFTATLRNEDLTTVLFHELSAEEADYILSVATETHNYEENTTTLTFADNGLYDPADLAMESIIYALQKAHAEMHAL